MTPAGKPVTSVVGIDPRVDLDGSTEGNGCIARHIFLYVPVEFEPFCILGKPVGKPLVVQTFLWLGSHRELGILGLGSQCRLLVISKIGS